MLAASAAGVGVLALSQPAEAEIIYTCAHHVIDPGHSYRLDLNHDKLTDFTLVNIAVHQTGDSATYAFSLRESAARGNSAIGYVGAGSWDFAAAMRTGSIIGPGGRFFSRAVSMAAGVFGGPTGESTILFGPWPNVRNRYLGLKFLINGKTHYAWARMSVRVKGTFMAATLTGYAYETIPDKAIIAGDEGLTTTTTLTLGRLALGRK